MCMYIKTVINIVGAYRVVSPISTMLRAVTGDCDPVYSGYMCSIGMALSIQPNSHTVDFCHSHRVTV